MQPRQGQAGWPPPPPPPPPFNGCAGEGEQAGWAARAIFAHNLEPWGRGLGGGRCWHEPGKVSSTPNTPWRLDPGGMEG